MMSSNVSIREDVERVQMKFNRYVGMLTRQFYTVNLGIKFKLFNVLRDPMYGLNLWINREKSKVSLKHLVVSYHLGLKKLSGYPKYYRNNYVCSQMKCLTLEHFLNLQALKFDLYMVNNDGSCMTCFKTFSTRFELDKIFRDMYQIEDIYGINFDALVSRLFYVQAHGNSSLLYELYPI